MKTTITCVVILVNILNPTSTLVIKPLPEEALLNYTAFGVKYGHQVIEHDVVTEDGYILKLFQIPGRRKPPVLLMHGIADSADTFIIRGKTSLAINLANAGFDVWAGNMRGNKYSRRHVKLNPDKDPEFWEYSFTEGGYYDLPAMLDYILKITDVKQVQTIGHSQGTAMHFVLLSRRPEYNEKIKIHVALAPIAYVGDIIPPVSTIAHFGNLLGEVFKAMNIVETFNEKSPFTAFVRTLCGQDYLSYELCFLSAGVYIGGFDTKRFERSFLKVYIGHSPGSTSRKSFLHFSQMVLSKRFCDYDYGEKGNLEHYGYIVPPEFNVREITAKVALIVGRNDPLSRIKDVEILRMLLPNVAYYHVMKPKEWNHIDFVLGNDMAETLFPLLLPLLE